MPLINNFDPWHSSLCTCPGKLTFNPYTGCDHGCLYCYATSYVKNHRNCHSKKDFLTTLKREASKLNGETVSLCNSSDPYPQLEASEGLMRRCLEVLSKSDCKIQIITKSNLVIRDEDLLAKMPATVALTITTLDDELASCLEPHAPAPSQRIRAAQDLTKVGIPVLARIDPIIPSINDHTEKLVKELATVGVKHVTASTYKAKPDNWARLATTFPQEMATLKPLYFSDGEKAGGNVFLPKNYRFKLLKEVRDLAEAEGMRFGVCREGEGLTQLNTAPCDGSWLMPKAKEGKQRRLA